MSKTFSISQDTSICDLVHRVLPRVNHCALVVVSSLILPYGRGMPAKTPHPLKISRILHAGYLFSCGGYEILFDPIFENPFSQNCFAFPDVAFDTSKIQELRPHAVFISHEHDDHFSLESLNLLNRQTPLYLYSLHEELLELLRKMGFVDVRTLQLGRPHTVGPMTVTPLRALDDDIECLFQIHVEGLKILNVVDAWIHPSIFHELREQSPWDLVLWPFQTLRELEVLAPRPQSSPPPEVPSEWREQIQFLNPKYLVPSSCQFLHESWSWYNHHLFPISYDFFTREMAQISPLTQVIKLSPGTSIKFEKDQIQKDHPLPWVIPKGPQDLDFDYRPDSPIPSIAEIARHFPALNSDEKNRLIEFCQIHLPARFNALERERDFEGPWALSLFEPAGDVVTFHYQIQNGNMSLATKIKDSWLRNETQISSFKLFSALKNGESLTSLYLRARHQDFDLLEDPLIGCLYSSGPGLYQKAQARKLGIIENDDVEIF